MLKDNIIKLLDKLYLHLPIISKFVPRQNFRYGLCGGANMAFDGLLYYLVYNFVLEQKDLVLPFITISAIDAAYQLVFPITLFTGFWLAKYVSFENSKGKTTHQSIKYLSVVLANLVIKHFGINMLVSVGIFPSFANVIVTLFSVTFSYLMQRYYTFRAHPKTS